MKWLVFERENGIHVVPDEEGHEYLVTCRCEPRTESTNRAIFLIHELIRH